MSKFIRDENLLLDSPVGQPQRKTARDKDSTT